MESLTFKTFQDGMETWLLEGEVFDSAALLQAQGRERSDMLRLFLTREAFIQNYGFCLPGADFVARVGRFGPVVEIGAGQGYLSALLRVGGVDSIATDRFANASSYGWSADTRWPVLVEEARDAIAAHPTRTVLCAWPCYQQSWAARAIEVMQSGQILMLVGEREGGCTGDETLFRLLDTSFVEITAPQDRHAVTRWPGIHDSLSVWKRT